MDATVVSTKPARYGQTCVNCVKAKCRCMVREGGLCERCHRLGKECVSSSTVRKRGPRLTSAAQRSKLEDKLDEVVSLLRTQRWVATPGASTDDTLTSTPDSFHPALTPHGHSTCSDQLSTQDLAEFCSTRLSHFPFMDLSESVTAEHIRLRYPILCLAIRVVCTKTVSRQLRLSKQLREILASRIVVHGEKSMDLLLGVITSIAWSTYATHGKQFLGTMCGLARSMISDLRLDKPPQTSNCPGLAPHVESQDSQTNEGRRAMLAIFILCASVSTTFRCELMFWSSQMEDACETLVRSKDCEGDGLLVTMAQLAGVTIKATEVSRRALDNLTTVKHAIIAIEPLLLALSNIRNGITPVYLQHNVIIALLHSAEVAIYELALLQTPSPTTPLSTPYVPSLELRRLDYFTLCVQTCTAARDHFLSCDITSMMTTSILIFPYCLRLLYKLSTLKDVPGWDPEVVKASVDIVQSLEQAAGRAEHANRRLREETGEDSAFAAAAEALRAVAPHWRISSERDDAMGDAGGEMGWNGEELSMPDFTDDFWLSGSLNF